MVVLPKVGPQVARAHTIREMARARAKANRHGHTFTTIYWKPACRFRVQGHGRRRRHDHNRHVEAALVATEAMAATDAMAGMRMPMAAGMELLAPVAAGMELAGMELVASLELAAAVGGDKSLMTCPEAARGVVQ